MNHIGLIERALRIVWRYKVLWLFGILLALTGGGGGGTFWQFNPGNRGGDFPTTPFVPPMGGEWENLPQFAAAAGAIVLCCCCLLLILIIASIVVRYVSQAALYRMVEEIDVTGEAPTWKEGFRLGWSNRTFYLWLMNLLLTIAFFLAALILALPVLSPLLLLLTENEGLSILGGILTAFLGILAFLVLLFAGAVVSGLRQFWGREIVLADRGVGESFATGFGLVRRNLKDVSVMWLLMLGIGLLFGLLMIPVGFIVLVVAAGCGASIGWLLYRITDSVGWAVAFGLPPFLVLTIVPLTLIGGLYAAFDSSVWTLTYREVAGREPYQIEGAEEQAS